MTIELKMPALSPTMEKGTLAKWLVGVGDLVKPGDLIAEIETDKATMEVEAIDEGRIAALIVTEGTDDIPVGTVIATIGGDEIAAARVEAAPTPVPAPTAAAPRGRLADKVKVSPLAARIAGARGIDLAGIRGSGPDGRVVKADLGLTPAVTPVPSIAAPIAAVEPPPAGVPYEAEKLSGMRKTIARRLTLAKQTVPHFYLSIDCRLDALLALRAELNAALGCGGIKISVNDILIKALAVALDQVPEANVQFAGDQSYRFGRVDVSMAVAIDGGLVTPVIIDAAARSLSAIAREAQSLAALARGGKLAPEQYQGGTVSISNLGMFGIERIFPVINPPQAMILGVGKAEPRIVPQDGAAAVATMLTATASFDHRAIDGAVGAQALAAFRELVEAPLRLLA